MTPELKRLIDAALDAHDVAIGQLRFSNRNADAAVQLTAHTAELVKDIAATVHKSVTQNEAAIEAVMKANRELLAALRAEEGGAA